MTRETKLNETYLELRDALAPLGVDVEREIISVWRDREQHGGDALPAEALKKLAELAERLLRDSLP